LAPTSLPLFQGARLRGAGAGFSLSCMVILVVPHTKRVVGLGSLAVRDYLSRVGRSKLEPAEFEPAAIATYGPGGSFGAVLYVEKEGFMPLFERVRLAKRYDKGLNRLGNHLKFREARSRSKLLQSSSQLVLTGHRDGGVNGVFEIDRVAGRALVPIAGVHAIVARAHLA
jgi:hypothetical protein